MNVAGKVLGQVIRFASRTVVLAALVVSCVALVLLGLGPLTQQYRVLTVQSGSMTPTLPVGSVIVVTPQPLKDVRVGDVITFNVPTPDRTVETHRVVQILQGGEHPLLLTQGDANANPDPWRLRLVEGPAWRVRGVFPGLGSVLAWLRQPLLRNCGVIVAPVLVALIWITEIWGTERETRVPARHGRVKVG